MSRYVLAGVLAILLPATVAMAQDQAPPPADKPVKEKKVCRRQEVTGSMFLKTTCHTKAEWEAIDAANRKAYDDTFHGASNNNLPGRRD